MSSKKIRRKQKLYIRYSRDRLELPIAVADSTKELAEILGLPTGSVRSAISKRYGGWDVVEIDEEEGEDEPAQRILL